jgi:membrane protein implicated in regulation of membrane protease activity
MGFFESLSSLEKVFAICAIVGGTLFVIRIALQLLGLHGHDVGGGADVSAMDAAHVAHGAGAGTGHDSDLGFKLLSLQGITAILLMFGLVGLAMSRQTHAGMLLSIVVAVGAAIITVTLMANVFASVGRLQSSGNIDIENAIGLPGVVYLNIPADGIGKVEITIQNRMRIYDASSASNSPLSTGDHVRVTAVASGSTLVVEKI